MSVLELLFNQFTVPFASPTLLGLYSDIRLWSTQSRKAIEAAVDLELSDGCNVSSEVKGHLVFVAAVSTLLFHLLLALKNTVLTEVNVICPAVCSDLSVADETKFTGFCPRQNLQFCRGL